MTKVNDKYYVPVEIEGKWWVVENVSVPDAEDYHSQDGNGLYFDEDGYKDHCDLYCNPPKYPTLPSDSAYWASKAGVKMTNEEFNLELVKSKMVDYLEYTAIPLQSPTTKELIEQEANNYIKSNSPNELIYNTGFYTGFVKGANFALSLPKQDNEDAWDEAIKAFEDETPDYKNLRLDIYIQHLYVYIRSNYSISKIK